MAGDCGLNALSLLPENVLPQWQQKICTSCRKSWLVGIIIYFGAGWIFRTKCDFLQVLGLLIFLQKQPGHWAEVVCIFTFFYIPYLFAKWQWELRCDNIESRVKMAAALASIALRPKTASKEGGHNSCQNSYRQSPKQQNERLKKPLAGGVRHRFSKRSDLFRSVFQIYFLSKMGAILGLNSCP